MMVYFQYLEAMHKYNLIWYNEIGIFIEITTCLIYLINIFLISYYAVQRFILWFIKIKLRVAYTTTYS